VHRSWFEAELQSRMKNWILSIESDKDKCKLKSLHRGKGTNPTYVDLLLPDFEYLPLKKQFAFINGTEIGDILIVDPYRTPVYYNVDRSVTYQCLYTHRINYKPAKLMVLDIGYGSLTTGCCRRIYSIPFHPFKLLADLITPWLH
jgi:hypothetical protein